MFYIPYENIDINENHGILFQFKNKSETIRALLRLECYGSFVQKQEKFVVLSIYFIPVYNDTYIRTKTGIGFYINLHDFSEYPVSYANVKNFADINKLSGKLSFYLGYFEQNKYTLIVTVNTRKQMSSVTSYTLNELKDYYFKFNKPSQLYIDKQLSNMRGISVFPL